MAAGPAKAAELIHTVLDVSAAPVPTRRLLVQIIVNEGWAVGSDAEDKADQWLTRFKSRLAYVIDEATEEGSYRPFTFNSSSDEYVQGYCFVEPGDPPEIADAKARRAHTLTIFNHVASITPDDFEQLSGKVLRLLKVEKDYVSRRSADQGVDFYGRVHFGDILRPSLLDPGGEKNFYVWLVGQSKHYPESSVSTQEVRELVGSVELAKSKIFAGKKDPLENFTAKACDPVFYLFFTTGRFTRDSRDVLSRAGVMSFNGHQLAQFLADHGIGIVGGTFNSVTFDDWLNQP